jgi:hypothetical protein
VRHYTRPGRRPARRPARPGIGYFDLFGYTTILNRYIRTLSGFTFDYFRPNRPYPFDNYSRAGILHLGKGNDTQTTEETDNGRFYLQT